MDLTPVASLGMGPIALGAPHNLGHHHPDPAARNTTLCLCPLECTPAPGDRCVVSPGRAQCPWDSLSVPGPSPRVCPQLGSRNTSVFPTRTVAAQSSVGAGGKSSQIKEL